MVIAGSTTTSWIEKNPEICGGDACIRRTRIMVWLLIELQRQGMTDPELIESYPGLSFADLEAAREYARLHPDEIERAIRESEAA